MCLTCAATLNEIADFGRTGRTIGPAGVLTDTLGDHLVSSMMDSAPSLSVAAGTEWVRSRGVAAPATAWRVVVPLSGAVFLRHVDDGRGVRATRRELSDHGFSHALAQEMRNPAGL